MSSGFASPVVGNAGRQHDGAAARGGTGLAAVLLVLTAELAFLALWTLSFARPYLDLDPDVVPLGREYLSNIQTHFVWSRAASCGWCAMWNGSFRGGYPALADPHGSMLHPLVIVTTLGWGVAGGGEAGHGRGVLPRRAEPSGGSVASSDWAGWPASWSACMVVVAGHLAGKMEAGNFGLLLSTAATALVLPPLLALGLDGGRSRRMAVVLGVTLALAAVAGQAYMQIGLLLMLPVVFLARRHSTWNVSRAGDRWPVLTDLPRLLRSLILAGSIALLLAAPFIVPTLHFLPQFGKDADATFRSAQPLAFVPLNLVINTHDFYLDQALNKLPFPYLYVTFVGWGPVLLAVVGLVALWTGKAGDELWRSRRAATFLAAARSSPCGWQARRRCSG